MSILQKLRERAGLSREELSKLSNVSYNSIMGYEHGKYGIRLEPAKRLADALATKLDDSSSSLLTELADDAVRSADAETPVSA